MQSVAMELTTKIISRHIK